MSVSTSPSSLRDRRPRILVIRRDNIGDLVCTTPLLAALRTRRTGVTDAMLAIGG